MLYLTIIGGVFIAWLILAVLFTPHIPYHIESAIDARSDHFVHVLESTCQTHARARQPRRDPHQRRPRSIRRCSTRSGRRAKRSTMECYIFKKGDDRRSVHRGALRAGARRRARDDRDGRDRQLRRLSQVGEAAARPPAAASRAYQRFTWYRLGRLNNRTHRELLVVDGTRGVRRRRRRRRLVGQAAARQADVARHDGAHRRPGGVATSRACCRRELARVLRRDPDRPGDLQAAHARPATSPAFAVKSSPSDRVDGVARAVPDAGRRRRRAAC